MKTFRHLFQLLLISLLFAACTKDHVQPPLKVPTYDPEVSGYANIKIAELKALDAYKDADSNNPILIDTDYIIKAHVTANDIGGNIYSQVIVEDATGALAFNVQANDFYLHYRVGQDVFIHMKGLYILKYGGEFQIGGVADSGGKPNRISEESFKAHAYKDDFANEAKVKAKVVKNFSDLTPAMANQLVQLENISFPDANGTLTFAPVDAYGSYNIKDASGNTSIVVRTSSYSKFRGEKLPTGKGTLTGILGRFNNAWQLSVRSVNDIGEFKGEGEGPGPEVPGGDAVYKETFGSPQQVDGKWPFVVDYKDFSAKAPIVYSDNDINRSSIRTTKSHAPHAWIPAGGNDAVKKDAWFRIAGINTTGQENLVLKFDFTANLYNADETIDQKVLQVKVGDKIYRLPSKVLTNAVSNEFIPIKLGGIITQSANLTVEFFTLGVENTKGFRVGNIQIVKDDGTGGVITPGPGNPGGNVDPEPEPEPEPGNGTFLETFGATLSANTPVTSYTGFDMKSPVKYTTSGDFVNVRSTSKLDPHVWIPAGGSGEVKYDHWLQIEGIKLDKDSKLSFDMTSNGPINLNVLELTINGTVVAMPDIAITEATKNEYQSVKITETIPKGDNVTIKFFSDGVKNTAGFRLDNIKLEP